MPITRSITKSRLTHREACPLCILEGRDNSQDNLAVYSDGHKFCYAGHGLIEGDKEDFIISDYTYEFIPLRGITKETLIKYNVKTKVSGEGKPVAIGFRYPFGSYKIRFLDEKRFEWDTHGETHEPGLFGKDRFSVGDHKYITITEGEFDALSLYQATRAPTVSVQSAGSGLRDCVSDRAFLNSFERIYLAFDGDAPGRELANKVARLFDFNKVYQVKFDKYKDANEYLQRGEEPALRNLWHSARKYQPDNIKSTQAEFDEILLTPIKEGVPYPFRMLTEMTYGLRTSESVLITAQEGVGKTELMHAIEFNLLKETNDAIGAIFLEEPKQRHLQALAGIKLQAPVHLPDAGYTSAEMAAAVREVVGMDDRLFVYSHFGSDDPESLLDTIRFLVSARGCRWILLDHITMVVSGLSGEDERRALDYFSTRLEMMVKELDFGLVMVSHVNDDGRTRGSRYISKVADIRIDATRDIEHDDPVERNTIYLSVSKNRFAGKTGRADKLIFDMEKYGYVQPANDNEWKPDGERSDQRRAA